jgi:hypothetical protein
MLAQDPIILFSGVVNGLPLYYRALAEHLADTGRVVIKDISEEKPEA